MTKQEKQQNYEEVMRRLALMGEPVHTYDHLNSPAKYYGDPAAAYCDDAIQGQAWVPTRSFKQDYPSYRNELKPQVVESQDDWNATGIELMAPKHVCNKRFNELRQQLHDAKGTPEHAELAQQYYSLLANA